jgi:hypothetical protein
MSEYFAGEEPRRPRFRRGSVRHMKNGHKILLCSLSVMLLGGCATQAGDGPPNPSLMAGASVVPKESVAAERCPESYRMRESGQGAFHRVIVC